MNFLKSNISKERWKQNVKEAIHTVWDEKLQSELEEKSTLINCCTDILKIGNIHPIWSTVDPCTQDVRRAIVKARLLTGTYMVQSLRSKFNNNAVDPTCPLCRTACETIPHFLLNCNALYEARKEKLSQIRNTIIDRAGVTAWNKIQVSDELLTKLVIDCTALAQMGILPYDAGLLTEVEVVTRELTFNLHNKRHYLLSLLDPN